MVLPAGVLMKLGMQQKETLDQLYTQLQLTHVVIWFSGICSHASHAILQPV